MYNMATNNISSINEYCAQFSDKTQLAANTICALIRNNVPKETEERMTYGMPTFFLKKNLVHFAVCKKHIGFYPAPSAIKAFEQELADYKNSKGAVQFPINKPLPLELITKMVLFRVEENLNA